jgi:hypothetical protein
MLVERKGTVTGYVLHTPDSNLVVLVKLLPLSKDPFYKMSMNLYSATFSPQIFNKKRAAPSCSVISINSGKIIVYNQIITCLYATYGAYTAY